MAGSARGHSIATIPTPALVLDAAKVRRNIARMATYTKSIGIANRPHTKTHKSIAIAGLQLAAGAVGLTVAKVEEALRGLSVADLTAISGVGAIVAESVVDYFKQPATAGALRELLDVGVRLTPGDGAPAPAVGGPLAGELVVVTGVLVESGWSRREAQDRIRAAGGQIADAVSTKTTLLVAGEKAGGKRAAAEKLGIRVIDERALLALVKGMASGG